LVTPILGPEALLDDTALSVSAQDYPDLEHIVVEADPLAGAVDHLARHPNLRIVRGRVGGHAAALNEGFRIATGDILGLLGAGDGLAPDALYRVAEAVDPRRGRHVVIGRCRLADARGQFLAAESPARFAGRRRVLGTWTGRPLPVAATFWSREAWNAC